MKPSTKTRILKVLLTIVFIVGVIIVSKRLVTPTVEGAGQKIIKKPSRKELELKIIASQKILNDKTEENNACYEEVDRLNEEVERLKKDECVVVAKGLQ
tara:strand:+ start:406 stop:702 length:297 start_codon:yes stop_codon:yes gene_type:complete